MGNIGILLTIVRIIGLVLGGMMIGDIGILAMIGATTALLSGIGFIISVKKIGLWFPYR